MSMPFYVSPEQLMKDRADFARKGIARGAVAGRRAVRRRHPVRRREPLAGAAQGQRDLRPDRVRRGRPLQRVREPPDRRRPARRHARLLLRPPRRHRPRPRQRLRPDPRHDLLQRREKPYEVELFVAEVGDTAADDQIYRLTYDGQVADEHDFAVMGGQAEAVDDVPQGALRRRRRRSTTRSGSAVRALGQRRERGDRGRSPSANLEVAVLDRTRTQQRQVPPAHRLGRCDTPPRRRGRTPGAGPTAATRPIAPARAAAAPSVPGARHARGRASATRPNPDTAGRDGLPTPRHGPPRGLSRTCCTPTYALADGSVYVGSTRGELQARRPALARDRSAVHRSRRPVTLVWAAEFDR